MGLEPFLGEQVLWDSKIQERRSRRLVNFLNNCGYFLGCPIIRTLVFGEPILGPPFQDNYHLPLVSRE